MLLYLIPWTDSPEAEEVPGRESELGQLHQGSWMLVVTGLPSKCPLRANSLLLLECLRPKLGAFKPPSCP